MCVSHTISRMGQTVRPSQTLSAVPVLSSMRVPEINEQQLSVGIMADKTAWSAALDAVLAAQAPEALTIALAEFLVGGSADQRALPKDTCARAFRESLEKLSPTWNDHQQLLLELEKLMVLAEPTESLDALLKTLPRTPRFGFGEGFMFHLLLRYIDDVLGPFLVDHTLRELDTEETAHFLRLVVSVPDRLSSRAADRKDGVAFLPYQYFSRLCGFLSEGLCRAHDSLKGSKHASLKSLGTLMGKLAEVGQEKVFVSSVLADLIRKSEKDFIWRRIGQSMWKYLPNRTLEAATVALLETVDDGKGLLYLTGHDISSPHLDYILTRKLFFNRVFAEPVDVKIYRSLLQYFCALDLQGSKFKEVLLILAEAWSSGYGQRYMAFEYELSVTKALLMAAGVLKSCIPFDEQYGSKILKYVLRGVEKRLFSPDTRIRMHGMVVGQAITEIIQPSPDNVLNFELPETEDILVLKALLHCIPTELPGRELLKHPTWMSTRAESHLVAFSNETEPAPEMGPFVPMEDADSDDDLIPCITASDTHVFRTKYYASRPKYLQECYEGLTDRNDAGRRRVCLQTLPSLLAKQQDVASQMAEDLIKILLAMELEGSLSDCKPDRVQCLTQLAVDHSKKVGMFFGREIRSQNYGLGTRIEMLQIVRSAVAELSGVRPQHSNASVYSTSSKASIPVPDTFRNQALKQHDARANPLAAVARLFVLPLLSKPKRENRISVIVYQEDALLLSHLVHTLGLIMHHARNLPDTPVLALRILEFVWDLKTHPDPTVRQAVLSCVAVVLDAVPLDSRTVTAEYELLNQIRDYLSEIHRSDPSSRCMDMAGHIENQLDRSMRTAMFPVGPSGRSNTLEFSIDQKDTKREISVADIRKFSESVNRLSL